MKIYLITQSVNNDYDTYDSMVVIANSADEAMQLTVTKHHRDSYSSWAAFADLECSDIGIASEDKTEPYIVLASFNAG